MSNRYVSVLKTVFLSRSAVVIASIITFVIFVTFYSINSSVVTHAQASEGVAELEWGDTASILQEDLKNKLPASDFGGVWLGYDDGRIKVGVVKDSPTKNASRDLIMSSAKDIDANKAIDIVEVDFSHAYLQRSIKEISDILKLNDSTKSWTTVVGERPDINKIEIILPVSKDGLNESQKTVINNIDKIYASSVSYDWGRGEVTLDAACNWWFCNSPLRGGVGIEGSSGGYNGIDCTAGFIAKKSGVSYVITAGHCAHNGPNWASETYNYTRKVIGPASIDLFSSTSPVDALLIKNPSSSYWGQFGKILKRAKLSGGMGLDGIAPPNIYDENYSITGIKLPAVNDAVCISPAITGGSSAGPQGGSCGRIKNSGSYMNLNTKQIFVYRASYCAQGGDSGAPIYRNNKAIGTHSGHAGSAVCSEYHYFTPINAVLGRVSGLTLY